MMTSVGGHYLSSFTTIRTMQDSLTHAEDRDDPPIDRFSPDCVLKAA